MPLLMPYRRLSPEVGRGVGEACVTRAGTDGVQEVPRATQVFQVQHYRDTGTEVLVYDEHTARGTIQPADQLSDSS